MSNKKNKSQTMSEYLLTYGWAILIIIVVVAALYAMGVFTPTNVKKYPDVCSKEGKWECSEYVVEGVNEAWSVDNLKMFMVLSQLDLLKFTDTKITQFEFNFETNNTATLRYYETVYNKTDYKVINMTCSKYTFVCDVTQ